MFRQNIEGHLWLGVALLLLPLSCKFPADQDMKDRNVPPKYRLLVRSFSSESCT